MKLGDLLRLGFTQNKTRSTACCGLYVCQYLMVIYRTAIVCVGEPRHGVPIHLLSTGLFYIRFLLTVNDDNDDVGVRTCLFTVLSSAA